MKHVRTILIASLLAVALVSCSTTGSSPGPSAPSIGSFQVKPASIAAGDTAALSWTVTGKGVTLSIDHGVGDVTGKTTVNVTPSATTTYTLTASNSAGKATATAKVTVTPAPVAPSITSFTASPATVTQGSSSTLAWTVTGTGPITLSIDHSVGDVSNTTSTTVTPAASTTYTLTATNSAGSDTAQATVTVTAPTTTTVSVTQTGTVPWIAVQDGAGAWTALTGSSFDVTDTGGRYGVAWACTFSPGGGTTSNLVIVDQLTTADTTTVAAGCPANTTANYYGYSGTVSNIPSGGYALVSIGANQAKVTNANPGFTLFSVQSGPNVAIAYGFDSSGQPTDMVVQSLNVTGTGTWDPDLATGQPFTMNQATASNAPAGSTQFINTSLYPAGPPLDQGNASTSVSYATLPGGPPSGTLYNLQASAFDNASTNSANTITYTSSPAATLDLPLPPYMGSGSGLSVASGTPTVTWGDVSYASSGGSMLDVALLSWSSGGTGTLWEIVASKDWLNGSLSYALPDFSATAGWNSAWDFPSGVTVDGTLVAFHADVPFASYQDLISAPGVPSASTPLPPDPSTFQSSQFTFSGTY